MKRLVICCDGTWNKPENENVTNIEKIARTIEMDPTTTDGVQQLVQYIGGVGANWYWVDRVLGGAFGLGLFGHVTTAYRFLALNYQPGDQILVFGFSRGAYTARSLVGMLDRVGLLTRESVIAAKLPEAVNRYRRQPMKRRDFGSSNFEFKKDHCHPDLHVDFLGVFDTVGALGVPGAFNKRHTFHDVELSSMVVCARQALAIDERRIKFEPCLWDVDQDDDTPGRVKQVWFEGAHSDVGGGYASTGLSDTALLWMLQEANMQGLAFNKKLLDSYLQSNSPAERHNSMNLGYVILNWMGRLRNRLKKNKTFKGSWRRLDAPGARDVRIASSALQHFEADDAEKNDKTGKPKSKAGQRGYLSQNIRDFKRAKGTWSDESFVQVIALPEPAEHLGALLAGEHVDLSKAHQPRLTH